MIKLYTIKNFLIISRAKIQIGTFPHAVLGILLASNTLIDLYDWLILVYILLYFSLITYACNINCLYDMDVDKLYKKDLSTACSSLGIETIKILLILEIIVACILIFFLIFKNHLITSIFALFGLLFATLYSIPPFRLKKRGILSPIPVIIGLYILPLLGGWFLVGNIIPLYFFIFIIGYALMNEGFTLVNTCEDYQEDKKVGIRTWAHIFGLHNTLNLALILSMMGYLCILALFLKTLILQPFSSLKIISVTVLICLSLVTISISVFDIWKITKGSDLQTVSKIYAKKMPKWFIMTRYPMLFVALLILI